MDCPRILIVDDEPDILEIEKDILETSLGARCFSALNGGEALEILKREGPQLIVTDVRMPEMDGFELLKEVRVLAPKLPVIFVTGYGDMEAMRIAWKHGAYDFISKPLDEAQFVSTVTLALKAGADYLKSYAVRLEPELARSVVIHCEKSGQTVEGLVNDLLRQHVLKAAS